MQGGRVYFSTPPPGTHILFFTHYYFFLKVTTHLFKYNTTSTFSLWIMVPKRQCSRYLPTDMYFITLVLLLRVCFWDIPTIVWYILAFYFLTANFDLKSLICGTNNICYHESKKMIIFVERDCWHPRPGLSLLIVTWVVKSTHRGTAYHSTVG